MNGGAVSGFIARQVRGQDTPWANDYSAPVAQFSNAFWLVRVFYAMTLYISYTEMRVLWDIARTAEGISPLWPVWWVSDPRTAGVFLLLALLFAGLLGVLFTSSRPVRVVVFLAILEATAYRFSFGGINHLNHTWLWVAFCFAFLPSGSQENVAESAAARRQYLVIFFATQGLLAVFYTLSGLMKAFWGLHAVMTGQTGSFSPFALAVLTADRLMQVPDASSILGVFLVDHPWLGWPAHLWVIYVEVVAILIVFRPELHRLWGIFLVMFHVGTFLLLGISWNPQIVLLTLLFLWSPFAPPFNLARTIAAIPGIDLLLELRTLLRGGALARGEARR